MPGSTQCTIAGPERLCGCLSECRPNWSARGGWAAFDKELKHWKEQGRHNEDSIRIGIP